MHPTARPHGARQFPLFHPGSPVLHWAQVPVEVQQQVLRLLARLLRQEVRRSLAEQCEREERRDD